jgi:hypothetical protein
MKIKGKIFVNKTILPVPVCSSYSNHYMWLLQNFNVVFLHSQSAVQFSDDELPPDVDLNDPFFTEELEKSERNGASEKMERKQKKKKKKGENIESEEEKRKKVKLKRFLYNKIKSNCQA